MLYLHPEVIGYSVKYKNEFEADIESQLDKIDDKTLLFLPNIKEIIIDGQSIMDADNWDIVRTCSGYLPAEFQNPNRLEVKRFDIKMAMTKGDDDGSFGPYPLYNYLPT